MNSSTVITFYEAERTLRSYVNSFRSVEKMPNKDKKLTNAMHMKETSQIMLQEMRNCLDKIRLIVRQTSIEVSTQIDKIDEGIHKIERITSEIETTSLTQYKCEIMDGVRSIDAGRMAICRSVHELLHGH